MFKQLALATALAAAFASAHAVPAAVVSNGTLSAALDNAGNFDSGTDTGLGISYGGVEYLKWGVYSSWYCFMDCLPGHVAQFGSNPFGAVTVPVGTSAATTFALGGWSFSQTVFAAAPNKLTVHLNLTNNTGRDVAGAMWGVGLDPDQDIPFGGGFTTLNTIQGQGANAAVEAVGAYGGYSVVLANDTSAAATAITAYINMGNCCGAVDPATAIAAAQLVGTNTYADDSISLAYQLGTVANGQTVSIGYSYTFSAPVPEPGSYALMLAGMGVIGFLARRRRG